MVARALGPSFHHTPASVAWNNREYGISWHLKFICHYHDEDPELCFQAGNILTDYYWQAALRLVSFKSYWVWSAYLRENLNGELRDKAIDEMTRMEEPFLTQAMSSDNYSDCADFCTMYPTSPHYYDVSNRYFELQERDMEADTLRIIAGQYSHKDSALLVLNNVTYGLVSVHTTLLDKTSGECIMTTELTPCSDALQVKIPTGDYAIVMEYTTDSIDTITNTIELNAKQYVYNVQIVIDEEDHQLHDLANATIVSTCNHENSLILDKYNSISKRRTKERNEVEKSIDNIMRGIHNRNMSRISCGPVDMTGANIGTTLILQNLLLSYIFPHGEMKKGDKFIVYTIPANDYNTHAPIIVAAPCNPSTPYEVEQREQALRTLNFFLAADTMDNPKQHGTIHFVFYKRNEYLHQIGDLFKGEPDSPQVALAIDEWVSDTINVESPESQGSVTFTPPVPQVKTDYSHTDLPHALYHICPAMVGALPESIYSALR